MTVRHFRWIFLGLLGLCLVLDYFFSERPGTIGASAEWVDGRYTFSAGTQPWALGFAVLIVGAFVLLMDVPCAEAITPLLGLKRRFAAFCLDFLFGMSVLSPLIGILPVLVEWSHTGTFEWSFERTTQAASDLPVMVLSFVLLIPGLLFWFALPLVLHRPSPGECIAGYRVIVEDGHTISLQRALLRSLVGFFACAGWLASFVWQSQKKGEFWLDKMFHTRAVRLT